MSRQKDTRRALMLAQMPESEMVARRLQELAMSPGVTDLLNASKAEPAFADGEKKSRSGFAYGGAPFEFTPFVAPQYNAITNATIQPGAIAPPRPPDPPALPWPTPPADERGRRGRFGRDLAQQIASNGMGPVPGARAWGAPDGGGAGNTTANNYGGSYAGAPGLVGVAQSLYDGQQPSAAQIGQAIAGPLTGLPGLGISLLGLGLNHLGFSPSQNPHGAPDPDDVNDADTGAAMASMQAAAAAQAEAEANSSNDAGYGGVETGNVGGTEASNTGGPNGLAAGGRIDHGQHPAASIPGIHVRVPLTRAARADGGPAPDPEPEGIVGYHGTPHDFPAERLIQHPTGEQEHIQGRPGALPDVPQGAQVLRDYPHGRFRDAAIGSGAGAQVFGHGHYMAQREGAARDYRDTLTDRTGTFRVGKIDMPKWILRDIENAPDRNAQIEKFQQDFQGRLKEQQREQETSPQPWLAAARISNFKDISEGLDALQRGSDLPNTKGRLLQVRIRAHPEHFLDWDKLLSEQKLSSEAIDSVLMKAGPPPGRDESFGPYTLKKLGEYGATGRGLYARLSWATATPGAFPEINARSPIGASAALRAAGIPGVRYLDGDSRGQGEGTHNYVVFDPAMIDIEKKYAAGGLIQDKYPTHYMPDVGRQVMADGGYPQPPPTLEAPATPVPLSREPPVAYFEIAPGKTWNPALQQSWEQLHPQAKQAVSNRLIGEFLSPWQRQTGIQGEVRPGLGGFEGNTNPNYTFHPYNPAHIKAALHGLGTLFQQDAMMGAHAQPFEGSSPAGVVRIHLPPDVTQQHAHEVYKTLHDHGLADGHSTDLTARTMDILSGNSGAEANRNALLMDNALGNRYKIQSYPTNVAFPEHGADYASDAPSGSKRPDASPSQANPGLHDQASRRLKELVEEAHRQGAGQESDVNFGDTLAPGQLHPDVVSASMPTTVSAYKGPPKPGDVRADISPRSHSQKNYDNIATRMWAQHPASGGQQLPAAEAANKITDLHVKNLLNIWDRTPVEQRKTSRHWYRSAHALGNALGDLHSIPPRAAHAIMAVLSPQNPWDTNVTQAERLMDIVHHHQDTPWTEGMTHTAYHGGAGENGLPFAKGTAETGPHTWSDIEGKTLREVLAGPHGDTRGAMWVRAFDEAHNPSEFKSISPTGEYGATMMIPSGEKPAIASWNSYNPIQKALSIWRDSSLENINRQIGSQHKVREFYNTITNPNDPNAVVIDTHAVAAGQLLPHGSSAKAVHQNFGTGPSNMQKAALAARGDPWIDGVDPSKTTGSSGATGDYPFHAEAARQAAWQRGVHPSEMQSVTWEAIRQLFTNKSERMQHAARAVWSRYANGELTHPQTVDAIYTLFGGASRPNWAAQAGQGTGNIRAGGSYARSTQPVTSETPARPRYASTGGAVDPDTDQPREFDPSRIFALADGGLVDRALQLIRTKVPALNRKAFSV